jgi:hypothetical protein
LGRRSGHQSDDHIPGNKDRLAPRGHLNGVCHQNRAALEVAARPADDYRRALATYALANAADALGRTAEAGRLRRHAAELRAGTRTPPLRVLERLLRAPGLVR